MLFPADNREFRCQRSDAEISHSIAAESLWVLNIPVGLIARRCDFLE